MCEIGYRYAFDIVSDSTLFNLFCLCLALERGITAYVRNHNQYLFDIIMKRAACLVKVLSFPLSLTIPVWERGTAAGSTKLV